MWGKLIDVTVVSCLITWFVFQLCYWVFTILAFPIGLMAALVFLLVFILDAM